MEEILEKRDEMNSYVYVKNLEAQIQRLRLENAEYKRQALEWHQKFIQAEEVIDQLKNELLAVLRSKADFKASVIQYMLIIREAQLRIEHAIKQLRGKTFTITKWVAITIIALAVIGAFIFVPNFSNTVILWLSNPANQFFVIVLAVIIGFVIYYAKRRGR